MAARGLNQSGRTGDWMVRAGLMEKIMSKTTTHNSESREVRELTERELKDDELELVSGGFVKQFEAGTAGDDQLFGSDYADSIFGFAGNDSLRGGAGN